MFWAGLAIFIGGCLCGAAAMVAFYIFRFGRWT